MTYARYIVPLLALLACSHEASRENPLDPSRSPGVELSVALDDSTGAARLTWTAYAGEEPLAAYWVLRREAELARWDTLASITDAAVTSFTDTALAANTAYGYRVSVVTEAGFESTTPELGLAGFQVLAPELVSVTVDSLAGTAHITWRPFRGPRFAAYRLERRTDTSDDWRVVAESQSVSDTTWVDADLLPQVSHIWRVVAVGAGAEWASAPSGRERLLLEPVRLLAAASDSAAGSIRLRWSGYDGPDFERYRVLRRVLGTDREDEVGVVLDAGTVALDDSTALADVAYAYRVEVAAAGLILVSEAVEATLRLPALEILEPVLDSTTASALVSWVPYTGPRFERYDILRRTASEASRVVATFDEVQQLTFVDEGLQGNTDFIYQVVAVTHRGEMTTSPEARGTIHGHVATWPLPSFARSMFCRLQVRDGTIEALVTLGHQGYFLTYEPSGEARDQQQLFDSLGGFVGFGIASNGSVSTTRGEAGSRLVGLVEAGAGDSSWAAVVAYDADWQPEIRETLQTDDLLPAPISGHDGLVRGLIRMRDPSIFGGFLLSGIWLSAAGEVLVSRPDARQAQLVRNVDAWDDFRFEVELYLVSEGNATLEVGTTGPLSLVLELGSERSELTWQFAPPDSGEPTSGTEILALPIIENVPYRLLVELADGQLAVALSSPVSWRERARAARPWTSMAELDAGVALAVGERTYLVGRDGAVTPLGNSSGAIAELRSWPGVRGPMLGACFPEAGTVRLGTVPAGQEGRWPALVSQTIGPDTQQRSGYMHHPVSFDVGPDGRIYVLDAGNNRIVVFSRDRKYLTEWGTTGTGDGEFDFGSGQLVRDGGIDFNGSVAVGDDGYVYVADGRSGRIQKFAP